MTGKRHKLCKGFTLIELLVVIAIIALLLSILMPALNKVKEQAKIIICASNMHQSSQGAFTYATEFDGYLPPAFDAYGDLTYCIGAYVCCPNSWGRLVPRPYGWLHIGSGYLPDAESLICPSDKPANHVHRGYTMTRARGHFWGGVYMSYNYFFFPTTTWMFANEPGLASMPRYRIEKSPGKAVIMIDQGDWSARAEQYDPLWPPYHKKGSNTLHIEGHVNFVKTKPYMEKFYDLTINHPDKFPGGPYDSAGIWSWNWRLYILDNW